MSDHNPINLMWYEASFSTLLRELDWQLTELGAIRMPVVRIVARATLQLLENGHNPTPTEIIEYVRDNPPEGGWVGFNERRWMIQVARVVHTLKSHKPQDILGMV